MTAGDLATVVRGIAPVVREFVEASLKGLLERVSAVEQRASVPGRDGRDGETGPRGEQGPVGEIGPQGPAGEKGIDGINGKDADPLVLKALQDEIATLRGEVIEMKAAAVEQTKTFEIKALDPAVMAEYFSRPDVMASFSKSLAETAKEYLPAPSEIDPSTVEALVNDQVTKAIAALPVPKDGHSVTMDDVAPLIASEVTKAVAALPVPVGVATTLIDRDGHLIITHTDGATKDVGPVVGKDGQDGRDGKDVDPADVKLLVVDEVAKIPVPSNGRDGRDGHDGLGFDDMTPDVDGEGRTVLRFARGDVVKTVRVPGIVDMGVYRPETAYVKGDGVTYGGSFWIAKADSQGQQPGTNAGAAFWRLAVKKGADGRQGPQGTRGNDGTPGAPGRDGRNY